VIGTAFFKVFGSSAVLCSRCAEAALGSLDLGTPLYPNQFPGTYRFLTCRNCGATCSCHTERCGTAGCHRLRASGQEQAEGRPVDDAEAPSNPPIWFDLTGQGTFRF